MADPTSSSPPPYGSFSNFWAFLEEMSQHGVAPQVLDRAVYGGRSDATAWEIQNALRFFRLIDSAKRPTELGKSMIERPDADILLSLLKEHYPAVLDLGLESATTGQVDEVLRGMGARDGGTLRKARTFFLHAAQRAGVPIGPHLRTPTPATRAKPRPKPARLPAPTVPASAPLPALDLKTRYIELLMSKVEQQETLDDKLLNRIERALGISPIDPSSSSPESPIQGDNGEPGEGEQLVSPHPAGN